VAIGLFLRKSDETKAPFDQPFPSARAAKFKKKPKNLTGKFRTWASYETSNGHRLFDVTCLTGNLGGETHGLWAKPFAATAAYRAKEKAL